MYGRWRDNLARWGVREWAMTGLAFVVICAVVLTAGRGLAFGPDGQISGIRFGGDAQRTRVVLDLGKTTRGQVIEDDLLTPQQRDRMALLKEAGKAQLRLIENLLV